MALSSDVKLIFAARNLPKLDLLSSSDPFVVCYYQPFGSDEWQECGRTEVVKNNRNADFSTSIKLVYRFEEQQKLKFEVYDCDSQSANLRDHDLIGGFEITLAQLVSQRKVEKKIEFKDSKTDRGTLIVLAEQLGTNKEEVELQFGGFNLDKKDMFGSSDPFLVVLKPNEMGDYIPVGKTEVIKKNTNPTWKPITVSVTDLCNGQHDLQLKIDCWDWNSSGSHSFIGHTFVSLKQMIGGASDYPLINPKKQGKKKGYENSGKLRVLKCTIKPNYTFLDYVQGGTQINCTIAIDFTASNGQPTSPDSLHYYLQGPTLYEQALTAVGDILQEYDTDKQFPVLGFGGYFTPSTGALHDFHVNLNPENPYCYGVQGVVTAYRQCLQMIKLHGPTNFAPIIRHVSAFGKQYTSGSNYFVLLILTDGVISDMFDTKEALVDASELPISVIIVGIGNADFTAMNELDSDGALLRASSGRQAKRDVVQFVPFNKFLNSGLAPSMARHHLAREVLREIPEQFVSYMKSRGIVPNPPRAEVVGLPTDPSLYNS